VEAVAASAKATTSHSSKHENGNPDRLAGRGKLKSLLVKIDDVVAEGQAIAIVET